MYLLLKVLHVLGVVLFVGNIVTGVFWKHHAERTRDPRIIAHAFEGLSASDRWFTIPGVLIITVFGVWAAIEGGLPILRTGWILWAIVLFIVSGVAFMAQVGPLQRKIAAFARASGNQLDWPKYRALAVKWEVWGTIATLAPLGAVALMVIKPNLPGL